MAAQGNAAPTNNTVQAVPTPALMGSATSPTPTVLGQPSPAGTTQPIPTPAKTPDSGETASHVKAPDSFDHTPKDIYLNFENSDLNNFVQFMADAKKLTLIPDKGIAAAKISLTMREPVDIDGAWNIFLTILEVSGFTIVKVGDVHKVVTKDQKSTEVLPLYINVPADSLPNSDLSVRYIKILDNIGSDDIKDFITGILSKDAKIASIPLANMLHITDKCNNIKAAMRVVTELDQTGLRETISVIELKQTQATDVKTLLDGLINKPDNSNPLARFLGRTGDTGPNYFSPDTKVVAEDRTNRLILMGNQKSISKLEHFIATYVDTTIQASKSPLHVYELQYADATQISTILQAVVQSGSESPAAKLGGVRNGVKYFKSPSFQVDETGNRIIVSSTDAQDWKFIKKTLQDLDKPQPQVAIETLIVSVTNNDEKALGATIRSKKQNSLGHNIVGQSANYFGFGTQTDPNNQTGLITSLIGALAAKGTAGSNVVTLGSGANIWALANMFKSETNSSVISTPFVTVTNRVKATVKVGETRQVQTGYVVGTSGAPGAAEFKQQPVSYEIDYTPMINMDGIINLTISVILSEFSPDGTSLTANGNTSTNELDTQVTIASGQVLVLGGFIKTTVSESTYETPLLSQIPILGWLFKSKDRTVTKTYTFIFICPTIIKPRSTPGVELYTKLKLHQSTEEIKGAVDTGVSTDPIHNWFFNGDKEEYTHKVIDYANARYQPTTVDIRNDDYYRSTTDRAEKQHEDAARVEAQAQPPALQKNYSTNNLEVVNIGHDQKAGSVNAYTVIAPDGTPQPAVAAVAPVVQPIVPVAQPPAPTPTPMPQSFALPIAVQQPLPAPQPIMPMMAPAVVPVMSQTAPAVPITAQSLAAMPAQTQSVIAQPILPQTASSSPSTGGSKAQFMQMLSGLSTLDDSQRTLLKQILAEQTTPDAEPIVDQRETLKKSFTLPNAAQPRDAAQGRNRLKDVLSNYGQPVGINKKPLAALSPSSKGART